MKDNINIDELFKQGFEGFEGDVDPSAWTNIQQNIGQGGASSASTVGGLSTAGKVAAIIGLVGVTTASVWYFSGEETATADIAQEEIVSDEVLVTSNVEVQSLGENILVTDTNDPVIQEHAAEIQEELNQNQYSANDIDDAFLVSVINENNFSNGFIVNSNEKIDYSNDNNNVADDENGNVVDDKIEPTVNVNPEVNEVKVIKLNLKVETEENNTLFFKSNAKNHTTVEWSFGDGEIGIGDEVSHTYERPGTYQLKMEVFSDDQSQSVERKIIVEGTSWMGVIPNVFTPNNDGRNDNFFVKTKDIETFYVSITDERGSEVFKSTDPEFAWNGENQGGDIVKGGYIVVIIAEGQDGQTFKEMKALRLE